MNIDTLAQGESLIPKERVPSETTNKPHHHLAFASWCMELEPTIVSSDSEKQKAAQLELVYTAHQHYHLAYDVIKSSTKNKKDIMKKARAGWKHCCQREYILTNIDNAPLVKFKDKIDLFTPESFLGLGQYLLPFTGERAVATQKIVGAGLITARADAAVMAVRDAAKDSDISELVKASLTAAVLVPAEIGGSTLNAVVKCSQVASEALLSPLLSCLSSVGLFAFDAAKFAATAGHNAENDDTHTGTQGSKRKRHDEDEQSDTQPASKRITH